MLEKYAGIVLLVEDEPLVRLVVVDVLMEANFRVIEASGADEALTVLKADVPVAAEPGFAEPDFFYEDDIVEPLPKLKAEKAVSDVSLGAGQEDLDQAAELGIAVAPPRQEPVRSQKVANRNDKVTVQYMDGSIKRDVKYKAVEEDLAAQRCVLVEEA